MGGAARPLHDAGNDRSVERGSNLQATRRGRLTTPAKPAGERENANALTPRPGTRSLVLWSNGCCAATGCGPAKKWIAANAAIQMYVGLAPDRLQRGRACRPRPRPDPAGCCHSANSRYRAQPRRRRADRFPPVCDSQLISAERLKPTLLGHSAVAPGMALPAPLRPLPGRGLKPQQVI
jgi:hypothetical protein